MGGIEQLKELMSINTCIEIDEIEKYFNQIAELLFGKFAIRKGNTLYLFKEVEFYFIIGIIVTSSLILVFPILYVGM